MKGNELNVEIKEKTQEDIARKAIEDIHTIISNRKRDLKEAEDKLVEILEKDVEDIKEKDGYHYEWD